MSSSPRQILVADSDEIVAALISHILQRQGYAVDLALSAADVALRLRQKTFNAVVIDSKLLHALNGFSNHLALIVLGRTVTPGAYATLPKPVEFGSLIETVAECVK